MTEKNNHEFKTKRYTARLRSYPDNDINYKNRTAFENFCFQKGISIERKTKITNNYYLYRIVINSEDEYRAVEAFPELKSLDIAVFACLDRVYKKNAGGRI